MSYLSSNIRAQVLEDLEDEYVEGWHLFDIAEIEVQWGPFRYAFRVGCNLTEFRVWYNNQGERNWYRLIRPDPNLSYQIFPDDTLCWARMYGRMITS